MKGEEKEGGEREHVQEGRDCPHVGPPTERKLKTENHSSFPGA